MSIFANIMRRTASQILDVTDAEVWVMEPRTESLEQTRALKDTDLYPRRLVSLVVAAGRQGVGEVSALLCPRAFPDDDRWQHRHRRPGE